MEGNAPLRRPEHACGFHRVEDTTVSGKPCQEVGGMCPAQIARMLSADQCAALLWLPQDGSMRNYGKEPDTQRHRYHSLRELSDMEWGDDRKEVASRARLCKWEWEFIGGAHRWRWGLTPLGQVVREAVEKSLQSTNIGGETTEKQTIETNVERGFREWGILWPPSKGRTIALWIYGAIGVSLVLQLAVMVWKLARG